MALGFRLSVHLFHYYLYIEYLLEPFYQYLSVKIAEVIGFFSFLNSVDDGSSHEINDTLVIVL